MREVYQPGPNASWGCGPVDRYTFDPDREELLCPSGATVTWTRRRNDEYLREGYFVRADPNWELLQVPEGL